MHQSWFQRVFSSGRQGSLLAATQARAERGDIEAQFGLGLNYATSEEGEGQDYPLAARWYRKAAEQNHALAQFNLATMYEEGHGVDQDTDEAAIWFEKAARQGDPGGQFSMGMRHRRASLEHWPAHNPESCIEAYKWFQLAARQGYHGAAAAYEQVNLHMSREDVVEGDLRAAAISALMPKPATTE